MAVLEEIKTKNAKTEEVEKKNVEIAEDELDNVSGGISKSPLEEMKNWLKEKQ